MHEPKLETTASVRPTVISVDEEPVGVVVPAENGFRFLAVKFSVFAIDGAVFDSVEATAEAAAMASARAAA